MADPTPGSMMKRMGEPFETAVCGGCGARIQHIWWGNGGTIWEHANGQSECSKPTVAKPAEGTVEPISPPGKGVPS